GATDPSLLSALTVPSNTLRSTFTLMSSKDTFILRESQGTNMVPFPANTSPFFVTVLMIMLKLPICTTSPRFRLAMGYNGEGLATEGASPHSKFPRSPTGSSISTLTGGLQSLVEVPPQM